MNRFLKNFVAIVAIVVAGVFVLVDVSDVSAHPGRTDAYGGHTCYTNCDSWGYSYGEYHYHGGYYEEPDYYQEGYDYGSGEALDNNTDYIVTRSQSEGRADGYSVGLEGESEDYSPDPPEEICDITFDFNAGSSYDWQNGVNEGYADACIDLASDEYRQAYSEGYSEGYADYESRLVEEANTQSESNSGWGQFFGWAFVVGIVWLFIYSIFKDN